MGAPLEITASSVSVAVPEPEVAAGKFTLPAAPELIPVKVAVCGADPRVTFVVWVAGRFGVGDGAGNPVPPALHAARSVPQKTTMAVVR